MMRTFLSAVVSFVKSLERTPDDSKYWGYTLSTTGAACLAIAFVETNALALIVGPSAVFWDYDLRGEATMLNDVVFYGGWVVILSIFSYLAYWNKRKEN